MSKIDPKRLLSKKEIADLEKVGVKGAKTEGDARKKLLKILSDNDIEDVDDETTKDLIEMAEAFYEGEVEEEEEELEEEESEEELEEISDEVEEKHNKKQAKTVKAVNKANKGKAAIPAKTTAKPAVKKKAVKIDTEIYVPLHKSFPEDKFEYNYLAKGGVSIKFIGKNSKKVVMTYDNLSHVEAEVTGDVFFLKGIPKLDSFLEGQDTSKSWSGRTFVKKLTIKQIAKLITKEFKEAIMSKVDKSDKTLGANRDKMESGLKGKTVAPVKKAVAPVKKAAVVVKKAVVPVKKVVAKPAAKVVAKKVVKKK